MNSPEEAGSAIRPGSGRASGISSRTGPARRRKTIVWVLLTCAGGAVAGVLGIAAGYPGGLPGLYAAVGLVIGATQASLLTCSCDTGARPLRAALKWTWLSGVSSVVGSLVGMLLHFPLGVFLALDYTLHWLSGATRGLVDRALFFGLAATLSAFAISFVQYRILERMLPSPLHWMRYSFCGWLIAWGIANVTWQLPMGEYARAATGGALGGLVLGVSTWRALARSGVSTRQEGMVGPPSSDATYGAG